jgi:hypothetical protein
LITRLASTKRRQQLMMMEGEKEMKRRLGEGGRELQHPSAIDSGLMV